MIQNQLQDHTHRAVLAERARLAVRRKVATVKRRVSNCLIRQCILCQILQGAPAVAWLRRRGLWRGMPGRARRRGRFRPRARLGIRRLLPDGRRSVSLEFTTSRLADNPMLELSAAASETLRNSLLEATPATIDDKTGSLSRNVSRIAS